MRIARPDLAQQNPQQNRRRFRRAARIGLGVVALLWLIQLVLAVSALGFHPLSLRPGQLSGLTGIFTMPLIHSGWPHLIHNTSSLIVLLPAMLYLYPRSAPQVIAPLWIGPGLWVWITAAEGSRHIGASGFAFALFGFLALSGLIRREAASLALSFGVLFLYGSMLAGILPTKPGISWESHLGGLLTGVIMAILFRRYDWPILKRYDWEDEEDEEGSTNGDDTIVKPAPDIERRRSPRS